MEKFIDKHLRLDIVTRGVLQHEAGHIDVALALLRTAAEASEVYKEPAARNLKDLCFKTTNTVGCGGGQRRVQA
jgi:hypothetical protein